MRQTFGAWEILQERGDVTAAAEGVEEKRASRKRKKRDCGTAICAANEFNVWYR